MNHKALRCAAAVMALSAAFVPIAAGKPQAGVEPLRFPPFVSVLGGLAQETDKERHGLFGPVRTVATDGAGFVGPTTTDYDPWGNIVEIHEYSSDGSVLFRSAFTYDAQGRLVENASYSYMGNRKTLGGKTVYTYDTVGNRNHVIHYGAYDDKGSLRVEWRETLAYDDKGRVIQGAFYRGQSNLQRKTVYSYDAQGEITHTQTYDGTGSLLERTIYRYDAQRRIREIQKYDAKGSPSGKTVYKYGSQGVVVEQEEYGSEGYSGKWIGKYESTGYLTERAFYDTNGSVQHRDAFVYDKYDSYGNWVRRTVTATTYGEAGPTSRTITYWPDTIAPGQKTNRSVHIFYYPWYITREHRPESTVPNWRHWPCRHLCSKDDPWPCKACPGDPAGYIASDFYPSLGAYSSHDPAVVSQHMKWIRRSGAGVILVSWWGKRSWEDQTIPTILEKADAEDLKVSFVIEPYCWDSHVRDSANKVYEDVKYLINQYGNHNALFRVRRPTKWGPTGARRPVFYIYNPRNEEFECPKDTAVSGISDLEWQAAMDKIHQEFGALVLTQTTDPSLIDAGHFDGIFTYDIYSEDLWQGEMFAELSKTVASNNSVFAPSVGPGYSEGRSAWRSEEEKRFRDRENGRMYDRMWNKALQAGSEWISITSFNEWHEGTQIEPAELPKFQDPQFPYSAYEASYGLFGNQAPFAYLDWTRYWVEEFTRRDLFPQAALSTTRPLVEDLAAPLRVQFGQGSIRYPNVSIAASGNAAVFEFGSTIYLWRAGRGLQALTEGIYPSINADGTAVAFTSSADPFGMNLDRNPEIFLWREKSGVTQLTSTTRTSNDYPSIGGDGMRVAFSSSADLAGMNPRRERQIYVWMDSSGFIQLSRYVGMQSMIPSITEEGNAVSFVAMSNDYRSHLRRIYLWTDATGTRLIAEYNYRIHQLHGPAPVARRGSRIFFLADADLTGENSHRDVQLFLWDGRRGVRQISPASAKVGFGQWLSASSDGSAVAFSSATNVCGMNPHRNGQIFVWREPDSLAQVTTFYLRHGERGDMMVPSLDASGKTLLFLSDMELGVPVRGRYYHVYRMILGDNLRSRERTGSIVFSSRRDGNQEIYLIDLFTASQINVTEHPADDGYPRLSPDDGFTVNADPISRGTTGMRSFFTNQSNVIRWNRNGRAGSYSPPL